MSQDSGTKFLHFRKRGANGAIDPRGGLTVAYNDSSNTRSFALAQCSKEDNFCKARGRELAANRLRTAAFARQTEANDGSFVEYISSIAAKLGMERAFARSKRPSATSAKAAKKATGKRVAKTANVTGTDSAK